MERDESYQELVRLLVEVILIGGPALSDGRKQDIIDDFVESSPLWSALGGISATLATHKLDIVLENAFQDEDLVGDARPGIMAAFLAFATRGVLWTDQFSQVLSRHEHTYAAQTVMRRMATMAYLNPATGPRDLEEMEGFLLMFLAKRGGQADAATVKMRSSRWRDHLKSRRLVARAKALEDKKSVDATVIEGELG